MECTAFRLGGLRGAKASCYSRAFDCGIMEALISCIAPYTPLPPPEGIMRGHGAERTRSALIGGTSAGAEHNRPLFFSLILLLLALPCHCKQWKACADNGFCKRYASLFSLFLSLSLFPFLSLYMVLFVSLRLTRLYVTVRAEVLRKRRSAAVASGGKLIIL